MANNRRSRRRGANRKDVRLPLLIALGFLLALFVIIMPKTPVVKAVSVSASGNMTTHAGLVISEVMTDNVSAYPDETGKFSDWVEIRNTLDTPINLKNVGLSDRSDRIVFLFPDVNLAPSGQVTVFCDGTNRDDPRNVFHAKFKLSSLGETVYLFDENGVAIDTVKIPTLNSDESYMRNADGEWEKNYDYSPGYPNTIEGHDDYLAAFVVDPGALRLNEVVPSPKSGLRDEDGEFSDWVELYNAGAKDISLSNFALSRWKKALAIPTPISPSTTSRKPSCCPPRWASWWTGWW